MTVRKFTNKEQVEFFFTVNEENSGHYVCICGKERKQKLGAGYQNLIEQFYTFTPWLERVDVRNRKRLSIKINFSVPYSPLALKSVLNVILLCFSTFLIPPLFLLIPPPPRHGLC
jgi:hypothetical protein